jgi:uncharacterized protein (TIGR04540 family)
MDDFRFSSLNHLSKTVRGIIDEYLSRTIDQKQEIKQLKPIFALEENRQRIFRGEEYAGAFKDILGKRRMEEFCSIVDQLF